MDIKKLSRISDSYDEFSDEDDDLGLELSDEDYVPGLELSDEESEYLPILVTSGDNPGVYLKLAPTGYIVVHDWNDTGDIGVVRVTESKLVDQIKTIAEEAGVDVKGASDQELIDVLNDVPRENLWSNYDWDSVCQPIVDIS